MKINKWGNPRSGDLLTKWDNPPSKQHLPHKKGCFSQENWDLACFKIGSSSTKTTGFIMDSALPCVQLLDGNGDLQLI